VAGAKEMAALGRSTERNLPIDGKIAHEAADHERRPHRQRFIALQGPVGDAALNGLLDLALRRYAEVLEELSDRLIECVLVHVELLERGQKAKLRITGLMGIAVLVSGHFHALAGFGAPIMARAERRRQAEAEPAVHQPPLSGVTPGDPGTVRLAALTLASVSLAAAAVPAWRAARSDPVTALRET
jgi:hypothetical protein